MNGKIHIVDTFPTQQELEGMAWPCIIIVQEDSDKYTQYIVKADGTVLNPA